MSKRMILVGVVLLVSFCSVIGCFASSNSGMSQHPNCAMWVDTPTEIEDDPGTLSHHVIIHSNSGMPRPLGPPAVGVDQEKKAQNFCDHPELRMGEIFLTNAGVGDDRLLSWETKRIGDRAYDMNGSLLPSHIVPIFVQEEELIEAGIDTHCHGHE